MSRAKNVQVCLELWQYDDYALLHKWSFAEFKRHLSLLSDGAIESLAARLEDAYESLQP